jgi:anti-sigma-K factor RskA
MSVRDHDRAERADLYVAGLLDEAEIAAIEAEAENDPALKTAIADSRARFLELDMTAVPVTLGPGWWQRIVAALDTQEEAGSPAPITTTVPTVPGTVANDNAARSALGAWRFTALAGMAASLLLAAGLAFTVVTAPEPRVIAVLVDDAGEPLVIVEDFGDATARIVPLVDFDVPEDRTLQVWTLPSQEMGPVSLGLLDRVQTVTLDGPVLPEPRAEQLYEITMEQEGGSPTGRPTGPILVKGFAKMPR